MGARSSTSTGTTRPTSCHRPACLRRRSRPPCMFPEHPRGPTCTPPAQVRIYMYRTCPCATQVALHVQGARGLHGCLWPQWCIRGCRCGHRGDWCVPAGMPAAAAASKAPKHAASAGIPVGPHPLRRAGGARIHHPLHQRTPPEAFGSCFGKPSERCRRPAQMFSTQTSLASNGTASTHVSPLGTPLSTPRAAQAAATLYAAGGDDGSFRCAFAREAPCLFPSAAPPGLGGQLPHTLVGSGGMVQAGRSGL